MTTDKREKKCLISAKKTIVCPTTSKKNGVRSWWKMVYNFKFWTCLSVELKKKNVGVEWWLTSHDIGLYFGSNSDLSTERNMRKKKISRLLTFLVQTQTFLLCEAWEKQFFFSQMRLVCCKNQSHFPGKSRERPWKNDFKVVFSRFCFKLRPFSWTGNEKKILFSFRWVWCAAKINANFPTKSRERPWKNDFKVVSWRFWFKLSPFYWTRHKKRNIFFSQMCLMSCKN